MVRAEETVTGERKKHLLKCLLQSWRWKTDHFNFGFRERIKKQNDTGMLWLLLSACAQIAREITERMG